MILTRSLVAAVALLMSASAASAQTSSFTAPVDPVITATSPVGPRTDALRAGIAVTPVFAAEAPVPVPMQRKADIKGRNLMIIGGAAILGGAIVGGDAGGIVSLAGLGVGLYGLYLYLDT